MRDFRSAGYLSRSADFTQGLEDGMPSVDLLLECQWDLRDHADVRRRAPIVPGLFLGRPSQQMDHTSIKTIMTSASLRSLIVLAQTLNPMNPQPGNGAFTARLSRHRPGTNDWEDLLQDLAETANLQGFEGIAAADLTRSTPHTYPRLGEYLQNRYARAFTMWQLGLSHHNGQRVQQPGDLYVYMLVLVCSLAQEED